MKVLVELDGADTSARPDEKSNVLADSKVFKTANAATLTGMSVICFRDRSLQLGATPLSHQQSESAAFGFVHLKAAGPLSTTNWTNVSGATTP